MTHADSFTRDLSNHSHPSFEALSSWRADGLEPDEAQGVQAHVAGCAQCQGIVADFATMAQAIRRFEPDAMLVARVASIDARRLADVAVSDRRVAAMPGVHDAETNEDDESDEMTRTHLDGTSVRGRNLRPGRRSLLGGALALVAVLALSVGFLAVFHVAQPTRPGGVTTIISGKLTWRSATLPPGVSANTYASEDDQGNISYLLVDKPTQVAGVWVSYDFTQHWKRLPLPPVSASAGTPNLRIDDNDAYKIVLVYTPSLRQHAPNSALPTEQQWVMFDTRASHPVWRQAASLPFAAFIVNLASWHTQTYELYATSSGNNKLLVSNDQMRTFTPVVTPIPPSLIITFWVQRTTGQLMIEGPSSTTTNAPLQFWLLALTGAHWTLITIPYYTPLPIGAPAASAPNPTKQPKALAITANYFVAQPSIGTTFSICSWSLTQDPNTNQGTSYACSWDSGKHWQRQPQTTAPCRGIRNCPGGIGLQPLAISPTGETLAQAYSIGGKQDLFLLPKNATSENEWEDIGSLPMTSLQGFSLAVAPVGDHSVVWVAQPGKTPYIQYYAVIP